MPTRQLALAGVLLAASVLSTAANADLYTVQLSGTITGRYGTVPAPFDAIQVGQSFTVMYTIDSAAPDAMPGDPLIGRYASSGYRLVVPSAGIDYAPPSATYVDVWNGQLGACPDCFRDTYWSVADLGAQFPGFDRAELSTRLNDDAGTVFTNDAQPTALNLAQFPNFKQLSLWFEKFMDPFGTAFVSGDITAAVVQSATEGACCNRWTGNCSITLPATCTNLGLRFDGVGVTCAPARCRPCPADFNGSSHISVQDIFDFLAAYFAGCP